jgi:hypothetical protein
MQVPIAQRTVADRGLPNVQVNTEVPGALRASNADLSNAASSMLRESMDAGAQLFVREQTKANQAAVQGAVIKATEAKNALLYDPKAGALNKRGQDAFGAVEPARVDWQKNIDDISAGLSNDAQRQAFKQHASQEGVELDSILKRHVSTEAEALEKENLQAGIAVSQDDAVKNFDKAPGKIGASIRQQEIMLEQFAVANGKGAAWLQESKAKAAAGTHQGVFDRLIGQGQDLVAKGYYEANKDAFNADHMAANEQKLQIGSLIGESQRQSDAIMKQHPDLETRLEAVKRIGDPRLRDEVQQRVEHETALAQRHESIARGQVFVGQMQALKQAGGDTSKALDVNQYFLLNDTQKAALKSASARFAGLAPVDRDDPRVVAWWQSQSLDQLAMTPESQLVESYPYLTDATFQRLSDRWALATDAAKGNVKKRAEFKSLLSDDEMVLKALRQAKVAGITANDLSVSEIRKDKAKAAAFNQLNSVWADRVEAYYGAHGTNPDDKVKQQMLDQLIIEGKHKPVEVKKGWFGSESKPAWGVSEDELGKVIVDPRERTDYVTYIRSLRDPLGTLLVPKEITNDQVEEKYKDRIAKAYLFMQKNPNAQGNKEVGKQAQRILRGEE